MALTNEERKILRTPGMPERINVLVHVYKPDGTLIPWMVMIKNAIDGLEAMGFAREAAEKKFPGHTIGETEITAADGAAR